MRYKFNKGLTIVELIVAVTIASIVILSLIPSLISIISGFARQSVESKNVQEVTNALATIRTDSQRNYGFLDFPLAESGDEDDERDAGSEAGVGFVGGGKDDRILLLTLPATTRPYQDASRKLVYSADTADCDTFGGDIVTYTAAYYVTEGKLYRRTVMDPGQSGCEAPYQKTSCLEEECEQKDILIAEGVSSFSVDYYQNQSDSDPVDYAVLEESGLDDITSAKITLKVSRQGQNDTEITYENSVRINIAPIVQMQLASTP